MLAFTLSLLAAILASLSTGQRIQTVEVANSRYFISNASPYSPTLNWFLAYQYCRNIGMELLSLEQTEETQDLTNFLRENNYLSTEYWTGGNQLGSAMWIWMSTGQPYNNTFNYWAAGGPPLTKSDQSCMSTQDNVWSPHNCMDSKAFICEQTRCFYYNYVTTNRVSSQGNSTILPGVRKRPSQLSSRTSNTSQAGEQQDQVISSLNQTESTDISDASTQPVTSIPDDTSSIINDTSSPITKIMVNVDQAKVMLKGSHQNESEGREIFDDPLSNAQNNEIVPSDPDLLLRLLQPPTQDFTPEEPEAREAGGANIMQILSRKETFSWALNDSDTQAA